MRLKDLQGLLRTAYFLEYRRKYPRDLDTVADKLDVSLRTAGTLNKQLKTGFFSPEQTVEPMRRITRALGERPMAASEIVDALNIDRKVVDQSLEAMADLGWLQQKKEGHWALVAGNRSFRTEDWVRRADAVNHSQAIFAEAVWQVLLREDSSAAGARNWSFRGDAGKVKALVHRVIDGLRQETTQLEEEALEQQTGENMAITIAFSKMPEEL